jgi:hypothetical protein
VHVKPDNSALIAAEDPGFDNPQGGGNLFFDIFGLIDIHTTAVHGGNTLEMTSRSSSITMICAGSGGTCKSPLDAPIPQIVLHQCPPQPNDPPGTLIHFPCILNVPDAAALRGVCFPEVGVTCNGGAKEKRFTAATFIDFTGSTITSDQPVTFTCTGLGFPGIPDSGDLKAKGATFLFDSLLIDCPGKVDLSDARLVMVTYLTVNTGPIVRPRSCPARRAST